MLFVPLILHSCLIFCLHFNFSWSLPFVLLSFSSMPLQASPGHPTLPSIPQYLEQEELNPETEAQSSPCLPNFIASISPSCFLFHCVSFSPAPQVALCSLFFIPFLLDSTEILLIKTFPQSKRAYKEKGKKDLCACEIKAKILPLTLFFFFFFNIYLFIWLCRLLVVTCGNFHFCCSMWEF